jgi:hypothetical protein
MTCSMFVDVYIPFGRKRVNQKVSFIYFHLFSILVPYENICNSYVYIYIYIYIYIYGTISKGAINESA